jgi:hypothetical protein
MTGWYIEVMTFISKDGVVSRLGFARPAGITTTQLNPIGVEPNG